MGPEGWAQTRRGSSRKGTEVGRTREPKLISTTPARYGGAGTSPYFAEQASGLNPFPPDSFS